MAHEGGSTRVHVLAKGEVVLGRGSDEEPGRFTFTDESVSRSHARLYWQEDELWVADLGSRNRTLRNGRPVIGSERVSGGDALSLGSVLVLVAFTRPGLVGSDERGRGSDFIEADPNMVRVFAVARRLASVTTTVLIEGETGSGKEVVAEHIHQQSERRKGPLVRVNCAAISDNLVESELFGHEKGAFTGADRRRIGHIESANGGTLFLDEVGDLALRVQAKLLLALENRCITRVGSNQELPVDVRVISATHKNLFDEVAAGNFRQDLYFRLAPFVLKVPPLRERRSEVSLLALLFAKNFAHDQGKQQPRFSAAALEALETYEWPGNVRELKNAVEHALILEDGGIIEVHHLPQLIVSGNRTNLQVARGMVDELSQLEQLRVEEALGLEQGNQTRAAKRLGITRRALLYRLEKFGLKQKDES